MKTRRVLVIDDNPAVRHTVGRMLESGGYTVLEADNGRTGMAVLAAHPCELVITDVFMPLQDGFETIRMIKGLDPSLPVIAMSGGADWTPYPSLHDAEMLGADLTLDKPFTIEALLAAVTELTEDQPRA